MITGAEKGSVFCKRLRINSENRVTTQSGDASFSIQFNNNLDAVRSITIDSAQFTNVFYNVVNTSAKYNNRFDMIVTGTGAGTYQLGVDPGRYNVTTLTQAINDAVNDALPSTSVTFNLSPLTNMLSFYVTTTATTISFRAPTSQPPGTLGRQSYWPFGLLGFDNPLNNVSLSSGTPTTAIAMPSLNEPSIVYLRSYAMSPAYGLDEKGIVSNIMLPIDITVPWLSLQVWRCQQQLLNSISYSKPRPLSRIDIELVDHEGDPLDLMGTPLNIECLVWLNSY